VHLRTRTRARALNLTSGIDPRQVVSSPVPHHPAYGSACGGNRHCISMQASAPHSRWRINSSVRCSAKSIYGSNVR
jgi:hypothetical protein